MSLGKVSSTSARVGRISHLQGIRALAFSAVFVYHLRIAAPNGFLGVDIFFVLSGFVLALAFKRSNHFQLSNFLLRRLLRLLPALLVMVTVVLAATVLLARPFSAWSDDTLTAIAAVFFSSNVLLGLRGDDYFGPTSEEMLLLHTWSLGAEFQLYLIFGFLIWASTRLRMSSVKFLGLVVSLSFSLFLIGAYAGELPFGNSFLGFYSPLSRFWELGCGAIAALVVSPQKFGEAQKRWLQNGALLTLVVVLFISPDVGEMLPILTVLVVLCTVLVCSFQTDSAATRVLSTPVLVKVGDASYSLYLWHWPIILLLLPPTPSLVTLAAVVGATFTVGLLSFYFVEPLGKRLLTKGRMFAWAVCLGSTLFVTILAISVRTYFEQQVMPRIPPKLAQNTSVVAEAGCRLGHDRTLTQETIDSCTWGESRAGSPIVLLGDSMTDQYSNALSLLAGRFNRPFSVFAHNACPVPGGYEILHEGSVNQPGCAAFQDAAHKFLEGSRPSTVVMAYTDHHLYDPSFSYKDVERGKSAGNPHDKGKIHDEHIKEKVLALREMGHEVVLVSPIPTYADQGWDITRCSITDLESEGCRSEKTVKMTEGNFPSYEYSFTTLQKEFHLTAINLLDRYCKDSTCTTHVDGILAYRDAYHLNAGEYVHMIPYFEEVFATNFRSD